MAAAGAARLKAALGGQLDVELFAAGSRVPPLEVLDAKHMGVVDGTHSG